MLSIDYEVYVLRINGPPLACRWNILILVQLITWKKTTIPWLAILQQGDFGAILMIVDVNIVAKQPCDDWWTGPQKYKNPFQFNSTKVRIKEVEISFQRIKITVSTFSSSAAAVFSVTTLLTSGEETPDVHFSVISPLKICHQWLQECPPSQVQIKIASFCPFTIPSLNYLWRNDDFLNVRSHFTN